MKRRLTCLLSTLLLFPASAGAATIELEEAVLRPVAPSAAFVPARSRAARADLLDALGARGVVATDRRSGGIRSLTRLGGFLTEPSERGPAAVALAYVRRHTEAFGLDPADVDALRIVRRERSAATGIEYLSWVQEVGGIPSIDTRLEASVAPGNRLLALTGAPDGDLGVARTRPAITAAEAVRAARAGRTAQDGWTKPRLVFHHPDGTARLAWRVALQESSTRYWDVLVDAATGAVVRRANRVEFARGLVYDQAPGTGGGATLQTFPDAWLSETGRLKGPNVHAFADVKDTVRGPAPFTVPAGGEVGPNSGSDWNYPLRSDYSAPSCPADGCTWNPDPATGRFTWAENLEQDVTQLFYYVNRFHDHLRDDPGIAFTSGVFEHEDAVIAQSLDGADTSNGRPECEDHVNNANMTTLHDGIPGFMQMYLWDPVDRSAGGCDSGTNANAVSGANDPTIVYHEYTHGLTSRLVTDATGEPALDAPQSGAMGEAWSDYYALDLLAPTDTGARDVFVGRYTDASPTGVRTQATDCRPADTGATVCANAGPAGNGGYTYGDFGKVFPSGPQVHSDGEIWGQTLWQLRGVLGVAATRKVVTDGLRGAPDNPSYLEVRNAMLQAAQVIDPSLVPKLWAVFAERGMGFYAASVDGDDTKPAESFALPPGAEVPRGAVAGRVVDSASDKPVAGAEVRVGSFRAATAADGTYAIGDVPAGGYGNPVISRPGYDEVTAAPLTVTGGQTATVDARLIRNWALGAGGARYSTNLVPDYASFGCGPAALGDRDGYRTGWVTDPPATAAGPFTHATLTLPEAVEVSEVAIDPGPGCTAQPGSGLKTFELLAGPSEAALVKVLEGSFAPEQSGTLVPLALGRVLAKTKVLRLVAKGQFDPVNPKSRYIDVAELVVRGKPSPLFDPPAVTLGAVAPTPAGALVRGTVDGRGAPVTSYVFEYGRTTAYGSRTPALTLPPGATGALAVSAAVAGLPTRAAHHVRLVATNEAGTVATPDGSFATTYGLTAAARLKCPRRGATPRCTLTLPGLAGLRSKIELRRNVKRFLLVKSAKVGRTAAVRLRVPRAKLRGKTAKISVKVTFRAPKAKRATSQVQPVTVR